MRAVGTAVPGAEQPAPGVSDAHLRRLVESNVIGVIFWDDAGRIREANEAFLAMVGYSRDELLSGRISWRQLTPAEYEPLDQRAIMEVRATGRCTPYEKDYVAKSGARVRVLIGAARFEEAPGHLEGVAYILDLSEQVRLRDARDQLLRTEQAARIEAERANARLALVVDGSKRLERTMSAKDTLDTLAHLVVPVFADWCYIAHQGWNDGPALVAAVHADPDQQALLAQLEGCMPDPTAPEGAPRAFRTGEVVVYSDLTPEHLSPVSNGWPVVGTRDPGHLQVLRELGMRSLMCVPIHGRTRVDAVMMLVSTKDSHHFSTHEIRLVQDLAGRAAASLEHSRLLAEALDAVQSRDDFLAVAAHELRTPLTSLLLNIQLLDQMIERGEIDSDVAHRGISVAERQARNLHGLVDGLLDVARSTSEQLVSKPEEIDLRQVVDGVALTLAPDLQRAGCRLTIEMPAQLTGCWDRVRIAQVLTNLLANAMKFGAGKAIELSGEATPDRVRIAVRDHGIGISADNHARIFGRFERAVATRHFGGLGLGLYISSQIVRAHHGTLRVESEQGQGACFIIELPRHARSATLAAAK